MILEWILIAYILKRILDRGMLQTMTPEEYERILKGNHLWLR